MRFSAPCFLLLVACSVARAGVIGSPEPAASEDLLATFDWHWSDEIESPVPISAPKASFDFAITFEPGVSSFLTTHWWPPTQLGTSEFTHNDPGFDSIAAALADTVDSLVSFNVHFRPSPTVGSNIGYASQESYRFGSALLGAEITRIRCAVTSVTFEQTSPSMIAASADATWSFYGSVPEPGAGLAFLATFAVRRRRAA